MRKKIVAGNWKMNHEAEPAYELARQLEKFAIEKGHSPDLQVIIAPPFVYLESMAIQMHVIPLIGVAAQNCHDQPSGAYTGEVAAGMLKSVRVEYVIVGHSERRTYFRETNETIRKKVERVLKNDMRPIFCCGEGESVREAGDHFSFVATQLKESLFVLSEDEISQCVIAYEPIWAIGTGKTATPEQAQEMHAHIRGLVTERYDSNTAADLTILYGGSCKPSNASDIFAGPDVDGGLIGGASLKSDQFIEIINALDAS